MKAEIKIGRIEGFINTYNLFFENGLRLSSVPLAMASRDDRQDVLTQFAEVVRALNAAGFKVTGVLEDK